MNGPIAQIVALTCYGNAFLRWGRGPSAFFPGNSTCVFCDRVTFTTLERSFFRKIKRKTVANSPDEWFEHIKAGGATAIRLSHRTGNDPGLPDRVSAGFVGGGGTWLMEVLVPRGQSAIWSDRWDVWNNQAPDRRIWRVVYGRIADGVVLSPQACDLSDATAQLVEALRETHTFSSASGCHGFTERFAKALETLKSGGERLHGYHRDLAPVGCLSRQARTVLDACQSAWVFGGMGSWNDMGFGGDAQVEYERVSEVLFRQLNVAIAAAANESLR